MLRSYSPGKVFIQIGLFTISTWNELKVKTDNDDWTFYKGAYGGFTRLKRGSITGTITLKLPKTSLELSAGLWPVPWN